MMTLISFYLVHAGGSLPTHFIKSRVGKLKTRVANSFFAFCAEFSPKVFAHPGLKAETVPALLIGPYQTKLE